MSCQQLIQNFVAYSEEHFTCEEKGAYWVLSTPFSYRDGDIVQVFIREMAEGNIEISDLGHAVRKLNAVGINISSARSRRARLDAITRSRGIDFDRGRLFTYCGTIEFADHMLRLVQAMLQTEDMMLSRSGGVIRTFSSEVEEHLRTVGVGYSKGVRLQGLRSHEFDFQLDLPILTVIKGLSSVSNLGADEQANRLLGAITDLHQFYPDLQSLILLDDTTDVSWSYAQRILRTVTDDIYRFHVDSERINVRINALKQTAA